MRRLRPRYAIGWVVACAIGCAPPPREVQVDLERLLAQERTIPAPEENLPRPPGRRPAIESSVPGFRADVLFDPSLASEKAVEEAIVTQQQRARRELERRLKAVYREEARLFELATRRELEEQRPAFYMEANRKISARFEEYAEARSPRAAELYDLVGFPDPNPNNDPPRRTLGKIDQQRFDRSVALRQELAGIEQRWQREKQAILNEAEDALSKQEAAFVQRIRENADRLEAAAAREAAAAVRTSVKDLGLQLTDTQPLPLSPTPDLSITIPGEEALSAPPQVPSSGIPSGPQDRRQRIERELRIWLGVNRYRLSNRGRDATAEFQTWRDRHRAGL